VDKNHRVAERLCIANAASAEPPSISGREPEPGNRCYRFMAQHDNREPNPQEAQRDGQGAISQNNPLRELHQDGEAANDRAIGSTAAITPELTDEEVSVLCDVERGASIHPHKQPVLQRLREQGFLSEEPLAKVKLTSQAQQLLSKRGVGLNES
jgi:hypothetical protein